MKAGNPGRARNIDPRSGIALSVTSNHNRKAFCRLSVATLFVYDIEYAI